MSISQADWTRRILELAEERGLSVSRFASGAVRITGPGVDVRASSIDVVNPKDLERTDHRTVETRPTATR